MNGHIFVCCSRHSTSHHTKMKMMYRRYHTNAKCCPTRISRNFRLRNITLTVSSRMFSISLEPTIQRSVWSPMNLMFHSVLTECRGGDSAKKRVVCSQKKKQKYRRCKLFMQQLSSILERFGLVSVCCCYMQCDLFWLRNVKKLWQQRSDRRVFLEYNVKMKRHDELL